MRSWLHGGKTAEQPPRVFHRILAPHVILELLTNWTVRCAIAAYFIALALMLRNRSQSAVRAWWTTACGLLVTHVLLAFHVHHGWSHAAAYADTAQKTSRLVGMNWGGGIYFNYVLLAVWGLDVVRRWLAPQCDAWGWQVALHGFIAFMVFNATVVFESGAIRWGTALAYVAIAVLYFQQRILRVRPE